MESNRALLAVTRAESACVGESRAEAERAHCGPTPLHATATLHPRTTPAQLAPESSASLLPCMAACADQWEPPTPRSHLVPLPEPTLPVDHLVLLPPPMLPSSETVARLTERVSQSVANHVGAHNDDQQRSGVSPWSAGSGHPQQGQSDPQDLDWFPVEPAPKRLRRSAAIVAARNIPRQPSPFDLETEEGFDDGDEPDPSESMSPPPTSSSRGGGASKRKVSHSLIERRRREKINDCLAALRETVPNLREEGERKLARAKERGRKRGRGDDAGERGGLHKLEILQVRSRTYKSGLSHWI